MTHYKLRVFSPHTIDVSRYYCSPSSMQNTMPSIWVKQNISKMKNSTKSKTTLCWWHTKCIHALKASMMHASNAIICKCKMNFHHKYLNECNSIGGIDMQRLHTNIKIWKWHTGKQHEKERRNMCGMHTL